MKDKFVREALLESGIIEERLSSYPPLHTYYETNNIKEKLDAIIEYLGIDFEYTPRSKLIAKKKITVIENKPNE